MSLAKELGMTKRMLLNNIDSVEIQEWIAFFKEEQKKPKQKPEKLAGDLKNYFMVKKHNK